MKKDILKPRIRVNAETVRRLSESNLQHAVGGLAKSQNGPTYCPACITNSTVTGSVVQCCG